MRSDRAIVHDDIHLWRADLDVDAATLESCWELLSPEEHDRAQRFRLDRDRARFVASHGFVRGILAAYVDEAPGEIVLDHNPFGKPALVRPAPSSLAFNVSRTGNVMACAVVSAGRIGVDVESIDACPPERQEILQRFAPSERAGLERLPEDERATAIAACWTRKEAFVKARGHGLSWPLDAFEVSVPPDPPRVVSTMPDAREAARWSLLAIAPAHRVVGTIAVDRSGCRITPREWRAGRA